MNRRDRKESEAARYKEAAEAALAQVEICIRYLKRIQKRQLARRLERNSSSIARLLEPPGRRSRPRGLR